MDQALSTFFYGTQSQNNHTTNNFLKEDELLESTYTEDSDDMSSNLDEDSNNNDIYTNHTLSLNGHPSLPTKNIKPIRDISAPFQPSPRDTPRFSPMTERDRPANRVDYISTQFTPLQSDEDIIYDNYVGPTPESNWVLPGHLLVGAYPASQDDTETFELLTSILKLGVTKFVCLQLEYKSGVTESEWRSGQALRPYFDDVSLLVKNKQMFKVLASDTNVCSSEDLNFVHFPIKDCSVTDDGGVFNLAVQLVEAIAAGEVLYLHCWGGHGRTGTLVCIMLHLMYGISATEAMAYCQRTHDLRQCPVVVGSPQTRSQCDQVRRIVGIMEKQEERHLLRAQQKGLQGGSEVDGQGGGQGEPSHFNFKYLAEAGGEEELLCKRMAGKSFDAVEEDGVCHVTSSNRNSNSGKAIVDNSSANTSNNRTTSATTTTMTAASVQPSAEGNATTITTEPPQLLAQSHTTETSAVSKSSLPSTTTPSAQPPLKFRLVEKDANSLRNAYTQRVLGGGAQVPRMKAKTVTGNIGSGSTLTDVLPVVPSGGDSASNQQLKQEQQAPAITVTSAPVQAQPPKHSSPRSSKKGGLRGMRTHSIDQSIGASNDSSPLQDMSTEIDTDNDSGSAVGGGDKDEKCAEISGATAAEILDNTADHARTTTSGSGSGSGRKWLPFGKKKSADATAAATGEESAGDGVVVREHVKER